MSHSFVRTPWVLALALSLVVFDATAQRVTDEFDAPVIVSNKLYVDFSRLPATLGERYMGPIVMSDMVYRELGAGQVVLPDPANLDNGYLTQQLPFTLQFNGTTYTAGQNFYISVNGFVAFGSAVPSADATDPTLLFTNVAPFNVIAPYWGNHRYIPGQSQISWQLTGQQGKRKLTVEWKNLAVNIKNATDSNAVASFQLNLWERSVPVDRGLVLAPNTQNDIDFCYGPIRLLVPDLSYLQGASVGVKGTNGEFVNGLAYVNPNTATTSRVRSTVWPVTGGQNECIRMETYQRSVVMGSGEFTSRLQVGVDRDNGFAPISLSALNFNFNWQSTAQRNLWVNVNGFTTFEDPNVFSPIVNELSTALFINSSSYPRNVIAPFWGDHFYRNPTEPAVPASNGFYLGSEISYVIVGSYPTRRLVIQWRNLNINRKDLPSSIGNFQAILYEGSDERFPNNFAGGIEFAYGDVVNNPQTPLRNVEVGNASVGLKGNLGGLVPPTADFINGLEFANPARAFTSQSLTLSWRPSGGPNNGEGRRIFFRAVPRFYVPGWGDGDADLSQLRTRKHGPLANLQNRFVTVNDARLVLRWVVDDPRLPDSLRMDSLREGNAFHADVNHNGRFYYSTRSFDNQVDVPRWRRPIDLDTFGFRVRWDSAESLQGLPPDAGPLRLIYYEANETDAALIMLYMAARVPSLPWLWDTIPFPKVSNEALASNVFFGKVTRVGEGLFEVPVHLNGYNKRDFATSFTLDGAEVVAATGVNDDVEAQFAGSRVAIAVAGEFSTDDRIATLRIKANSPNVVATNMRARDQRRSNQNVLLEGAPMTGLVAYPNPASSEVWFAIQDLSNGTYPASIVDAVGQTYATLSINKSEGADAANVNVASLTTGRYFLRIVVGNDVRVVPFTVSR